MRMYVCAVVEDTDCGEDAEARALLNKFLGASVLMAGMQGYVTESAGGKVVIKQVCYIAKITQTLQPLVISQNTL